ncbi:MAG: ABC transporter permease subunit [Dehalococcoidia bacterium]
MRVPNIISKSLRDQRWQILGFGIALASMSSTTVFLWPSVRDTLQNFELPAAVKAFLGTDLSIATAAGYLSARYFGWIIVLLITYAVIQGTGAVAGEEGAGTMDLLLAQPVRRRDVLLQRTAAVCAGAAAITMLGWLGFAISVPFVGIQTSLADTLVASANMLPITLFFFALSLWLGAVAPSRGLASGVAIGLVTAGYFVNTLANGVRALDSLKYASPFYYYGAGLPLVNGIDWPHVALLLGLAAAFVLLALYAFERRDVATGGGDIDVLGALRRRRGRAPA